VAKKQEAEEPAPTNAEKFAAFIDGLVSNQTISADVGALVKHAIEANKSKL
jgi:hypothetical protein